MEALRVRAGNEELKAERSQKLIERERKDFYSHIEAI